MNPLHNRRPGDTAKTARTLAGFLLVLAVVAGLYFGNVSDKVLIVLGILGGVLISGEHIADVLRAWRGKNGAPPSEPNA